MDNFYFLLTCLSVIVSIRSNYLQSTNELLDQPAAPTSGYAPPTLGMDHTVGLATVPEWWSMDNEDPVKEKVDCLNVAGGAKRPVM